MSKSVTSKSATAAPPSLDYEVVDELAVRTEFSESEIKRLWKEYTALDIDQSGLTPQQMAKLPQLQYNHLSSRLVSVLTSAMPQADRISFKDFVIALAVFAPDARRDTKLRFAFKAFDVDGDSLLGRSDLMELLRCLTPTGGSAQAMTQETMDMVVDKAMQEVDMDGDGALSYDEFVKAIAGSDFHSKLSLDL